MPGPKGSWNRPPKIACGPQKALEDPLDDAEANVKYRTYPGTDLSVSEIGFGVWTVSTDWWAVTDRELRERLLRDAYHKYGINFFDTADTYGDGLGETLLAETLGDVRGQIVIGTKFGYDLAADHDRPGHRERPHNWSAAHIRQACEDSLRRLRTDHIDLYQMHNPRLDAIQSEEVRTALDDLMRAGKVRYDGVALGPALNERQTEEARVAMRERGFKSVQIIYNLLEQMLGPGTFEAARACGAGVLVRVPHSSGLLEGNLALDTEFAPHDHRRHRPREWLVDGLRKIERLDFLRRGGQRTLGQAALQFVLTEASVVSALPNIYEEKQLAEFAGAVAAPDLSADELQQIAELYADNFGVPKEVARKVEVGV
jgi:aryl-alcohol dehydrogenase-like predicted oxidoreductase